MEAGDSFAVLSRFDVALGAGALRVPVSRQNRGTLIGWPLSFVGITRPNHMLKLIVSFVLLTLPVVQAQTMRSGEDVLRAMHDRYKDSWYRTVTFTQKSTTYKPDGTSSVETWYEAALFPGKLRIDIGPASDGKGYIFADGKITVVKDNKVVKTDNSINMDSSPSETFTASRWTQGNFLFPTRLVISPQRVARVKGRMFGSNEESIAMSKIASVHISTGMYLYIWYRGTFPRYRFDQLMKVGWKVLLPTGLALLILTAMVGMRAELIAQVKEALHL